MAIDTTTANKRVVGDNLLKATMSISVATDAIAMLQGAESAPCLELDAIRDRLHVLRVKVSGPSIEIQEVS